MLTTIAPENVTEEQVTALQKAGVIVSLGHSDVGFAVAWPMPRPAHQW